MVDRGTGATLCYSRLHGWAKIVSFVVLFSSSCIFGEQPQRATEKSAMPPIAVAGAAHKQTDNWSPADELPLLVQTLICPIKDAADFSKSLGGLKYPRERRPVRPAEKPFEKDVDAVAAAKTWITAHFGQLPQDTLLVTTSIDHSSSGRSKPAFDWDEGHTIVFRETYNGIQTDSFAVIYITGQTRFNASVKLHTYTPIPGTAKRIVDKAVALKAWQDRIKEKGYDAKTLAGYGYERNAKPRLVYVWSKVHYRQRHSDVIAPTWALGRESKLMVDGQTGLAWLND